MNSDTSWMLTRLLSGAKKHGNRRWLRQRTSLQIETLEPRWALAASSAVSPIQAIWFAEVTAETHLQSAGGVGASSDATNNTSAAGAQQSVAYDWIVQFDVGAMGSVSTVADTATLLDDSVVDFQIMRGLGQVGQVLIRTTEADELLVANWLDASDAVAGYMRDSAVYLDATPNDPSYVQGNLYGLGRISAPAAWDVTTGSNNVIIAVLDSGVQVNHPDLQANMWVNPGEIAGNSIDDDGNGFVDDINGWNFITNTNNVNDDNGHGTHVAGTIGAVGNNAVGVVGVNWNVKIMTLKFIGSNGSGSTSDAISSINYVTMMKTGNWDLDATIEGVPQNIVATSNSWGGDGNILTNPPPGPTSGPNAMLDAINYAGDRGILFIAAAGNNSQNIDTTTFTPAGYNSQYIISVAASGSNDNLASFSNYGAVNVNLAAPGVNILSTYIGSGYNTLSGTSMATPHVAGVVALAAAVDPSATPAHLRNAILAGVDQVPSLSGLVATGGRLNAQRTLQELIPQFQFTTVATGFSSPIDVTSAGDGSGRLYVVEQAGRIRVIQNGAILGSPLLNIQSQVLSGGERGLLGLAFHPDFANSSAWGWRRFYVLYNASPVTSGYDNLVKVSEFRVSASDPAVLDITIPERVILTFDHPQSNHNGGDLAFGPDDGFLYISSGDGGNANDVGFGHTGFNASEPPLGNAQDKTNLLGKILRIDVAGTTAPGGQYSIPPTNPFFGQGGGVRGEIFAYGLRNPYRMSFDDGPNGLSSPDRLFVGDVGQGAWEEIDLVVAGGNYGWRIREGAHLNPGDPGTTPPGVPLIDPIAEYPNPGSGPASVIGGHIYRGTQSPELVGKYIYADYFGGQLYAIAPAANGTWQSVPINVSNGNPLGQNIGAFGTDDAGELYIVAGSSVMKLTLPPVPTIIDNGSSGFATVGSWTPLSGEGYQNDIHFSATGSGNDRATWTFTVQPGQFQVAATWLQGPNRSTNSPFRVLDGATQVGTTVLVNQELAPSSFSDAGATWHTLGTYTITGSTLVVELTDNANEFVIADAIRIQRVGEPPPPAPEIQVLDGGSDIADNTGSVSFGSTPPGTPVTKTFTVTNSGTQTLTLSTPITVPAGYTVTSSFGSTSLAPGASTTFQVRLDAAANGSYSGQISFGNNDGDENPFNFAISGTVAAVPVVSIIDNGSSGFATVGSWTPLSGEGYQNDIHFSATGSGNDRATWTFTVQPGQFQVAATWLQGPNRSTNSPFRVLDGATQVGTTVLVNQELAPSSFSDAGATWHTLGTYTITGSTLVVELTDNANEFVIADAIRIQRVGEPPPPAPEIQVLDGGSDIADNTGSVSFGSTPPGTPVTKTFTVTNSGTQTLTLSTPITVPAGYTVTSSFGSTSLAPGASTTFQVRLDAAANGSYSGQISFGNNDGDENPFNFAISGTVAAVPVVSIIDNGSSGFATVGSWTPLSGEGYQNDIHFSATGSGNDRATWTFTVQPGQFQVAATWLQGPNRSTNSPFRVLDGATQVGTTVLVNQELAPSSFSDAGATWHTLGTYTITGSTLVVELTDNANEFVIADAIRIQRVGEPPPPAPEIQVLDGGSDIADNTGSVSFGSTPPGTPVTKTFTVTNSGTQTLTLSTPITVPAGYTVTSSFGSTSLAPGASTTFQVRLDAAANGSYSGQISFGNNDGDENPFNFAISGTVAAVPVVSIIDNGSSGFATVGSWTPLSGEGYQNDIHFSATGSGNDRATWTFTVQPGQFQVAATWLQGPNRSTNSPFRVLDGATQVGTTVLVNQELAPSSFSDAGATWHTLGTYTITGSTLVVELTDNANEFVIADAIRIQRVGEILSVGALGATSSTTASIVEAAFRGLSTTASTPIANTVRVTQAGSPNIPHASVRRSIAALQVAYDNLAPNNRRSAPKLQGKSVDEALSSWSSIGDWI